MPNRAIALKMANAGIGRPISSTRAATLVSREPRWQDVSLRQIHVYGNFYVNGHSYPGISIIVVV
jgi:hypothetical protein